ILHGTDRAEVDALVEQTGIDLGGRLVGEARCTQKTEYGAAFRNGQCALRARSGAMHVQRLGQRGAPAVDAGTRHVQGRAGAGGQTGRRRQGDDRVYHDASSLSDVASGMPNRAATFFWTSMIASACSNLRLSRAFSRLACASSAAKGFSTAGFGPRLPGVSAPRAPLSRCRRQSDKVDEYKPSRRKIAPIPPTSAATSVSAKTRSFACAVKVRRRGPSNNSGAAVAGAGTAVGLRLPSASTPAAPFVFASLLGMTM